MKVRFLLLFFILATKSLDTSKVSNKIDNDNNLQRSLIIQSSALFNSDENNMASIDWLKIYGIEAQKLDFFCVLQSAAFQHCDGIVTSLKSSEDAKRKTDTSAVSESSMLSKLHMYAWGNVKSVF